MTNLQRTIASIEDSTDPGPRPQRTFRQAVRYSVESGYVWMIWGGVYYRIVGHEAVRELR